MKLGAGQEWASDWKDLNGLIKPLIQQHEANQPKWFSAVNSQVFWYIYIYIFFFLLEKTLLRMTFALLPGELGLNFGSL